MKLDLPPPALLSDEKIVFAITIQNHLDYFEILYHRYYPFVYGQCITFFNNPQDAEDVTQEIFYKLYIKIDTFSFKSKFFTWFYRLVRNHCINHIRQCKHKVIENKNINPENLSDYFFTYHYDNRVYNNSEIERLKSAFVILSNQDQRLLLLKYCGGVTIREMAQKLHCGESALKMKLKRIKEKLLDHYYKTHVDIKEVV